MTSDLDDDCRAAPVVFLLTHSRRWTDDQPARHPGHACQRRLDAGSGGPRSHCPLSKNFYATLGRFDETMLVVYVTSRVRSVRRSRAVRGLVRCRPTRLVGWAAMAVRSASGWVEQEQAAAAWVRVRRSTHAETQHRLDELVHATSHHPIIPPDSRLSDVGSEGCGPGVVSPGPPIPRRIRPWEPSSHSPWCSNRST